MHNSNHFAEIIESSLQVFLAQSWHWDTTPAFGSLIAVATPGRTIFGVVHQVQTGSMDPTRHPFPYQKSHEELLQEQPQIFEFLKTTFSCLTISYEEKGHCIYMLPPDPPKIHAMIRSATREENARVLSSQNYLPLLFGASQHVFNIDELLLALFRHQTALGILKRENLEHAIATFSLLTGNDYRRLKLFLHRAQDFVQPK